MFAASSLALPAGTRCLAQFSGAGKAYPVAAGSDRNTINSASAAAAWVGKIAEITFSAPASGTPSVHRAWITSVSAGTSFDFYPPINAAYSAPAATDSYAILDSPVPVIVADSGDGTTVVDGSYGGSNDDFNGYFLLCIAASNVPVGECKRITDYAAASGTFTVDFSANAAANDVYLCVMPVAAEGLEFVAGQEMLPRPIIRNASVMETDHPGVHRPTVSFSLPIKSAGSAPGDGVSWATIAKTPLIGLLSEMCGSVTNDTSEVIAAGSAVDEVKITTGTQEQFTAGNAVLVNGELAVISSLTDGGGSEDSVNVADTGGGPNLSLAPVATAVCYASKMIRNTTPGSHWPITFLYFEDTTLKIAWGCVGSATIEAAGGQRAMIAFSFSSCQAWDAQLFACPVTLTDDHYPDLEISDLKTANARVILGTTAQEIQSASVDLALAVEDRADLNVPSGSRGGIVTASSPTMTLTGRPMETPVGLNERDSARQFQALLQWGRTPGNVVGIVLPAAQIVDVTSEVGEGIIRETWSLAARHPDENDPLGDGGFRVYFA